MGLSGLGLVQGGFMARYLATSVEINADTDHCEGWVAFQWPHERYGHDSLRIDLDGHCSWRMPIHSGNGPPEFVELRPDGIRLRFDPSLAMKLGLEQEVDFLFSLGEADFAELRSVVEYFEGSGEP